MAFGSLSIINVVFSEFGYRKRNPYQKRKFHGILGLTSNSRFLILYFDTFLFFFNFSSQGIINLTKYVDANLDIYFRLL
jgi:hypothetical protein